MGIFSGLFGGSEKRRLTRTLSKIERETAPLRELGKALIVAATWCADQMKGFINDDADKIHRMVYVDLEFLYFFMHMTNRTAFRVLGHERRSRLQEDLGPAIVHGTIETYFAHWPEEMKRKMESECFQKLNDAEMEYAACQGFYSPDESFTSNTLCARLATNVAKLANDSENPVTASMAINVTLTAINDLNLDKLVEEVGKAM